MVYSKPETNGRQWRSVACFVLQVVECSILSLEALGSDLLSESEKLSVEKAGQETTHPFKLQERSEPLLADEETFLSDIRWNCNLAKRSHERQRVNSAEHLLRYSAVENLRGCQIPRRFGRVLQADACAG